MDFTIIQCKSGRWLAWHDERPDIIASGETKDEAYDSIKEMYTAVIQYEENESKIMLERKSISE